MLDLGRCARCFAALLLTAIAACGGKAVVDVDIGGDEASAASSGSIAAATSGSGSGSGSASTSAGAGGGAVVTCPAELPLDGSACEVGAGTCTYEDAAACGVLQDFATCEGGAWSVAKSICTSPLPDPCTLIATEGACDADASCRWLNPGCGEPALPGPGCYPLKDCAFGDPAACPTGQKCTLASADCEFCQTCSMDVLVCLGGG